MEPQTITRSPRLPHPCYHIHPCFSNIPPFQVLFHYTIQPPWIICLSGTNAKWYVSLVSICLSVLSWTPTISHQGPSTWMGCFSSLDDGPPFCQGMSSKRLSGCYTGLPSILFLSKIGLFSLQLKGRDWSLEIEMSISLDTFRCLVFFQERHIYFF